MKSLITKRSIMLAGRNTSVSLEAAFWTALKEIAAEREMNLSALVAAIASERQHKNLSSAIRVFVLDFYLDQLSVERALLKRPIASSSGRPDHPQHEAGLEE